jgi:HD-like signal output (HDOD) protein/CheY-like chemotaxis protein
MKKRILFVDDEPKVLEGLEDLLARHRRKWEMCFAPGGAAALERMRQSPFDVIVTDMRMPEMDGATLLRIVKDDHPGTVRFVLSGHSEMEATMRTVPVAHQFLHKPCDADILEKAVERACDLQSITSDVGIRKVVGKLQRLPSLPTVYAALQRTLADEKSGAKDVARIIEQDIGMSAKVLQLVNSAFFGLGRRITTILDAVVYLGSGMVQKIVLATEVFKASKPGSCGGLSIEALRDHSVLTAGIAQRILGADRKLAEDAWAAGLLHDVGKLVLASELPDHLTSAMALAAKTGQTPWQAEQKIYGVSHAEVGAYLLGLWGLPYPIVEAVAYHHMPERVQQPSLDVLTAVHVANVLAHECGPGGEAAAEAALNSDYVAGLGLAHRLPCWRESAQDLACRRSTS